MEADLNNKGYAVLPRILSEEQCRGLVGHYDDPALFRNVISMARYRFGLGEYKYFNYPLPTLIQQLRTDYYSSLCSIANQWNEKLSIPLTYPNSHDTFLEMCHQKKQVRPTPLILKYEQGGHNTLHQDLYGEIYFPFQVVIVLTQQGRDHEGGEFVITTQVPRAQSRAQVIAPNQGDAVIFTTNFMPMKGARGNYRARVRHGISEVKSGRRLALGIIFHDAL